MEGSNNRVSVYLAAGTPYAAPVKASCRQKPDGKPHLSPEPPQELQVCFVQPTGVVCRQGVNSMRALLVTVGLVALAAWLDHSFNGGFYTQAISRMISDIAIHF